MPTPAIPPELFRNVVEFLDDNPTLYSVLLVSRIFNHEAERMIYCAIRKWEADVQLLEQLCQIPRLASHVLTFSVSTYTSFQDRLDLINATLRSMVNLKTLTIHGRYTLDIPELVEGCTFNLTKFTSNRWHDRLPQPPTPPSSWTLLQGTLLRILRFDLGRTTWDTSLVLDNLASFIQNAPQLEEVEISGSYRSAYPPLSVLFASSSSNFKGIICPRFPPDERMIAFLQGQKRLERLGIQTNAALWPALADSVRQMSSLEVLRIYVDDGEGVPIDPLFGADGVEAPRFKLDFVRLVDFASDPKKMVEFLNSQPSITSIQFPAYLTEPVTLPAVEVLYGTTAELLAFQHLVDTKPKEVYWMRMESLEPSAEDLEILRSILDGLRSFAVPWEMSGETLVQATASMKELRYLGVDATNLELDQIVGCLDQLPNLEVLRLVGSVTKSLDDCVIRSWFEKYPAMRRVSTLEELYGRWYAVTYLRGCVLGQPWIGLDTSRADSDGEVEEVSSENSVKEEHAGRKPIRTPEPKPRDILISEFKDDRWMQ